MGRRTSITRGNRTSANYAYDAASRLVSLAQDMAGTTYDVTRGFSYNPGGQVLSHSISNNAYVWQESDPGSRVYARNGLNQYSSVGLANYAYDGRGNLISTGAQSYAYDVHNRLIAGPAGAALSYDPAGRLSQATFSGATTRFAYDGGDLIGEYSAGGTLLRRYVHGPSVDEPIVWYEGAGTSDRRFLVADQLGSIAAVTNASGTVTTLNTYDEYGKPGANNAGRFQFTGQTWLPELGLYYYKARLYSPNLGRFLQSDPILYDDGMNLYAYVGNDPMNATDTTGMQAVEDIRVPGQHALDLSVFINGSAGAGIGSVTVPTVVDSVGTQRFASEDGVTVLGCGPTCRRNRLRAWIQAHEMELFGQWLFITAGEPDFTDPMTYATLGRAGAVTSAVRRANRMGCGCFVAGTLVATPSGLKPIDEIAIGDTVIAWDPETGKTSPQRVEALIRPEPKLIWRIETRDAGGEVEAFEATNDHPWYIEGAGWIETQSLRVGQRIETADGRGLTVLAVARTDRVERTYNLTVSGPHTFLVGEDGAVVHNVCPIHEHHLLPRQFAARFRAAGLDIEKYKVQLAASRHVGRGGVHGGPAGQSWNGQWGQFFRENPNATAQQILNQLGAMRSSFGI